MFTLILSIVYLGIATGFSTYSHYCMDKYVETTLWQQDMSHCGICGMSKNKSSQKKCCKEEHKQVKLEKDHKAAEQISKQFQTFATDTHFPAYAIQPTAALVNTTEKLPLSNAPPHQEHDAIYMLNCSYLI